MPSKVYKKPKLLNMMLVNKPLANIKNNKWTSILYWNKYKNK